MVVLGHIQGDYPRYGGGLSVPSEVIGRRLTGDNLGDKPGPIGKTDGKRLTGMGLHSTAAEGVGLPLFGLESV